MPSKMNKKKTTKKDSFAATDEAETTAKSTNHDEMVGGGGNGDEENRKINFLNDKRGHQTIGRRIAMYLSTRYSWYNPQLHRKDEGVDEVAVGDDNIEEEQSRHGKKPNSKRVTIDDSHLNGASSNNNNRKKTKKPSIAEAWAFFEHVTLNRYEVPRNHRTASMVGLNEESIHKQITHRFLKGERKLEMAEPGENEIPTKLYSPFHTPLSQMGDFGLGYGLYFSTLRAFAILSFVAGIINIPNLIYFASSDYSPGKTGEDGISSPFLASSAICTGTFVKQCDSQNCSNAAQ